MNPAELARQKLDRLEAVMARHLDSEWVGFAAMRDFRTGAEALVAQLEGAVWPTPETRDWDVPLEPEEAL